MQLIAAPVVGWWAGACFASAWFISREHSQRENQLCLVQRTTPDKLKWWDGFTGWVADRYYDASFPVIACCVVAWVMT